MKAVLAWWPYFLLALMTFVLVATVFRAKENQPEVPITTLLGDVRSGRVQRIEVNRNELNVLLIDGSTYRSRKEDGVSILTVFSEGGIEASVVEIEVKGGLMGGILQLALNFLPLLVIVGLVSWLIGRGGRGAPRGGGGTAD